MKILHMISPKNKFSKLLLASILCLNALGIGVVASTASAQETIFVTASQKAGRYSGPIYVRLTASNPEAKIWYTCRRDGTPRDLLKYESPILLTKSCALIYFAYVTTELESKIERTDFTILYSDEVKLETKDSILQLRNTGDSTVDIGGWELIAGTGGITIPPGTTLTPDNIYAIGKVDPASYELKSPEGYIKSQVSVVTPPIVLPPKKVITNIKVEPSTLETVVPVTPAETPSTSTTTLTGSSSASTAPIEPPTPPLPPTAVTPTEVTPIPPVDTPPAVTPVATPSTPTPSVTSDLTNIKASATESKNTSSALPIAITIVILIGGAIVGKQLQAKK